MRFDMRHKLIDLSHEIEHGMVTYRGLPAPSISDWLSRDASTARYAAGTTFQIGKIELLANTGTYIDSYSWHAYNSSQGVHGQCQVRNPVGTIRWVQRLVEAPTNW